ncbi:MAG: hypothetical protein KBT01_02870 [Clostridiales bacterium]|nr:hypothetical protein [Candidatus Blautia equi]
MKNVKKFTAVALASAMVLSNTSFVMAEEATEAAAITMEFLASETGADLLSSLTGQDMSWLKSASVEANASGTETEQAVEFVTKLNDTLLMSGTGYVSLADMVEYVKVNELGEQFFKIDLGSNLADVQAQVSASVEGVDVTPILEAVQDPEYQAQLLMNYGYPFIGCVDMPSVEDVEVSYEDMTATLSYTGFAVNAGKAADAVADDLGKLKEDEKTLGLINGLVEAEGQQLTGDMIDQAVEAINSAKAENGLDQIDVKAMYGLSEDGNAMGGYIALGAGSEDMKLADFVAFNTEEGIKGEAVVGPEDSNFGVQFNVGEEVDAVLCANHQGVVSCNVVTNDNGGVITIKPVTDYEGAPMADFEGFELKISFEGDDESGVFAAELIYNDEALFTLNFTAAPGENVEMIDISSIEAIDITDEDAMNAWVETIDPSVILENLLAAGVPEELLNGEAAE